MDGTVQHDVELASVCATAGFVAWAVRGRSSSVFGPSVWRGQRHRRAVALTFDDGPSESTPEILDILASHNVPATFFQCGANVERLPAVARVLGQAISSPVAGRLQRFFGVSNLRIDPTLPGLETNPQARLTLEQQVTPDLTFTYITNVTTSNPQVVRVEWSLSKQWSVVALREENGLFGLDFFYKRRFK